MPVRVSMLLACLVCLVIAPGLRAQQYSGVVVFGDSLSDSGNVAHGLAGLVPAGNSFTTNPDPVWAEHVAGHFGYTGLHSLADGTNFAFGGACVRAENRCPVPVPLIEQQIATYLAARPGQRADPDSLYSVWAGANDLLTIADSGSGGEAALAAVQATAEKLVRDVRSLQQAGARHIVVVNIPDLGSTQFARSLGAPQIRQQFQAMTTLYNQTVARGLAQLDAGIATIDAYGLNEQVLGKPATFRLTDINTTACTGPDSSIPVVFCSPEGSASPVTYSPGSNRELVFADGIHPTGVIHEIFADLVTATLAAPVQVSLAGEVGEASISAHRDAVANERFTAGLRSRGAVHGFAVARIGQREVDALPGIDTAAADEQGFTVGFTNRIAAEMSWGLALSLVRHDNEAPGVLLAGDSITGSIFGSWTQGIVNLDGALNIGRTSVDIRRIIALGPAVMIEEGETAASQFGIDVNAGLRWGDPEGILHGPVFGIAWLDQGVDGFSETGTEPTAMQFSGFDRESLVVRAGYRVVVHTEFAGLDLRPYANIAVSAELKDEPVAVTARAVDSSTSFTTSGYEPPANWVSAGLGVTAALGDQVEAVLGYAMRTGDQSRNDHLLHLGLRFVF